jgi:fluoride exporter
MDLVFVGIGGTVGSIVRYKLGKIITERSSTTFPTGTFIINISGAILLGLLSSLDAGKNVYLLLGDGFLGAYTTFSTFMYEGFNLFAENEKLNAFTYILGSLIIGIIGYFAGSEIGNLIRVL